MKNAQLKCVRSMVKIYTHLTRTVYYGEWGNDAFLGQFTLYVRYAFKTNKFNLSIFYVLAAHNIWP